ncbi:MAG: histidine phosphatase family protein [Candidatus Sericytochromatia bacterium]
MKTIYVARHAEAVPVGLAGVYHDFDRYLTDTGIELLERQAKALMHMEPEIQACFSSPLVRARQTATQLVQAYGCEVQSSEALGSTPDLGQVQRLLEATSARTVLLVTHQPFVVQLVSWLLTGDSELSCHFGTASVACLHLHLLSPGPRGELMWLMNSETMAHLAHGW